MSAKFIGGPADGRVWSLRPEQTIVTVFDGRWGWAYALAGDGNLYPVESWPDEPFDFATFEHEFAQYLGVAPVPDAITIPRD